MEHVFKLTVIHQVILAAVLSFLGGWGTIRYLGNGEIGTLALGAAAILIGLGIVRFLAKWYRFSTILIYLFIISSFIGPALFNIKVGPLTVFPYRLLLPAAVLMLLYYLLVRETTPLNKEPAAPLLWFYVFWLAYGIVSLVWAKSFTEGVKDIFFLGSGVMMIFLLVTHYKKERHFTDTFYIWIYVLAAMILLGFWNHFTLHHLPLSRMYNAPDYMRERPTAVFTNENDFASYISISVFFVLALIHHGKKLYLKAIGTGLLLSSLYLLMITSSRANLLAVFLGMLFWFLFFTNIREKRWIVSFGTIGLILFIVFFFPRFLSIYQEISGQITSIFMSGQVNENSMDIRTNLLKNSLVFVANSYGFGIGAGNAEVFMKNFAPFPTMGTLNIHNWWAEIIVHYGAAILALYIMVYLYLIYITWKIYKSSESSHTKMISQALSTGLVAFSLSSISPSSIMTLNYFWLLFALAISLVNYRFLLTKNLEEPDKHV